MRHSCLNRTRRLPNKYKVLPVILLFYATIIYIYGKVLYVPTEQQYVFNVSISANLQNHDRIIATYLEQRKHWNTSHLGDILFKNVDASKFVRKEGEKTYVILIWKYYRMLSARHLTGYDNSRVDPFDECSVNNCKVVGEDSYLSTADAVVVHLHRGIIPDQSQRTPQQRWIFLTDEAPPNSFTLSRNQSIRWQDFKDVFNWSMSYKSHSDIPVPYGRTVPLKSPPRFTTWDTDMLESLIPFWDIKNMESPAAIMMSNCSPGPRMALLKKLKKYLNYDGIGRCFGTGDICPGSFRRECPHLAIYYFYLSFENSFCDEYITEKVFNNAYRKGAIPVILGPSIKNCKNLLPPHSYIHVNEFASVEDLVKYIKYLINNLNELLKYHMWRINFKVENEHGYFTTKSKHYCRICEALNYNSKKEKIYGIQELSNILSSQKLCKTKHSLKELNT